MTDHNREELFEQAHREAAPTDDEYDSDMAVMLSQLVDDEPMWSCVVIAKKLHAAGFRRTVQAEPSDLSICECYRDGSEMVTCARHSEHVQGEPTAINGKWVCGKCAREVALGYDDGQMPEHHRTCPKRVQGELTERPSFDAFGEPRNRAAQELQAQGEPTDAQVEAAMREHDYSLDRETTRNVLRVAFATNQEENR